MGALKKFVEEFSEEPGKRVAQRVIGLAAEAKGPTGKPLPAVINIEIRTKEPGTSVNIELDCPVSPQEVGKAIQRGASELLRRSREID